MQTRAPAPIPPTSDLAGLRALYTRVHWLVIADMDRVLAENEKARAEAAAADTPSWALSALRNCAPPLRDRKEEYLRDYDHYVQQTDARSLETMRRFIGQARGLHAEKPEFDFLFEARPAAASEGGPAAASEDSA